MIFWNNQVMAYGVNPDPVEINRFAQMILILGAKFRGEIPEDTV